MRKLGLKVVSLCMVLLMVMGLSIEMAHAVDGSFYVKGSNESPNALDQEFEVDGMVAYCAEKDVTAFPKTQPETYDHYFSNASEYEQNSASQKSKWLNGTNHWEKIKKILYYGYNGLGNDPRGLQATRKETQVVIWYYTNGVKDPAQWNEACEELAQVADDDSLQVPDNYELRFYTKEKDAFEWQSMFALKENDPPEQPRILKTELLADLTYATSSEEAKVTMAPESYVFISDTAYLTGLDEDKVYTLQFTCVNIETREPVFSTNMEVSGQGLDTKIFAEMGDITEPGTYGIITTLVYEGETVSSHNTSLDDKAEMVVVTLEEPEEFNDDTYIKHSTAKANGVMATDEKPATVQVKPGEEVSVEDVVELFGLRKDLLYSIGWRIDDFELAKEVASGEIDILGNGEESQTITIPMGKVSGKGEYVIILELRHPDYGAIDLHNENYGVISETFVIEEKEEPKKEEEVTPEKPKDEEKVTPPSDTPKKNTPTKNTPTKKGGKTTPNTADDTNITSWYLLFGFGFILTTIGGYLRLRYSFKK